MFVISHFLPLKIAAPEDIVTTTGSNIFLMQFIFKMPSNRNRPNIIISSEGSSKPRKDTQVIQVWGWGGGEVGGRTTQWGAGVAQWQFRDDAKQELWDVLG